MTTPDRNKFKKQAAVLRVALRPFDPLRTSFAGMTGEKAQGSRGDEEKRQSNRRAVGGASLPRNVIPAIRNVIRETAARGRF